MDNAKNLRWFPFGPCPECALALHVSTDSEGQPTEIIHAEPACPRFLETPASPFLLWVLDCREAERRSGGDA